AWFDCTPRTVPVPIPPAAPPMAAPRPGLPAAAPIAAPAAAPRRPPAMAPCAACVVVPPEACVASSRHSAWSRVTYCARELPKVSTVGDQCDWETHADSAVAHRPTIRTSLLIGSPPSGRHFRTAHCGNGSFLEERRRLLNWVGEHGREGSRAPRHLAEHA